MKTFKEFLLEGFRDKEPYTSFFSASEKKLLRTINKDCSEFLNTFGFGKKTPKMLFRGYGGRGSEKDKSQFIVQKSIRTDRKPLNSTSHIMGGRPAFNATFNIMCEAAYGIKEIRKSSAFATASSKQASEYGGLYFFFPINNSKCITSPHVRDTWDDWNTRRMIEPIYDALQEKGFTSTETALVNAIWNPKDDKNDEMTLAVFKKQCEEKHAEPGGYEYAVELLGKAFKKKGYELAENFSDISYGYRGNELMFFGTPYYYMINVAAAYDKYFPEHEGHLPESDQELEKVYKALIEDIRESKNKSGKPTKKRERSIPNSRQSFEFNNDDFDDWLKDHK